LNCLKGVLGSELVGKVAEPRRGGHGQQRRRHDSLRIHRRSEKVTGGKSVGELTENHERTLRSAAVTAISPPVFGLDIVELGGEGNRCVAVAVPASVDGPHLIYRNDFFGAPIRNDADTVWMKEREVAAQ
jgi:hypothetical protein